MISRYYVMKKLDLLKLIGALDDVYREKGFQIQHFGSEDKLNVQFKKDEVWRTMLGLKEDLGIIFERQPEGLLMTVGAQEWAERAVIGTVSAALAGIVFPPLIALSVIALAGAASENHDIHQIIRSIDQLVREQDPDARIQNVSEHTRA